MNEISAVQETLVSLIGVDDYFTDASSSPPKPIMVMGQKVGDIASVLREKLTKLGIGVVVMLPFGDRAPGAPQLNLQLDFAIVCTENVLINQSETGTRKPCIDLVKRVMQLVDDQPNGTGNPRARQNKFSVMEEAFRMLPDPKLLVYAVNVSTEVALK